MKFQVTHRIVFLPAKGTPQVWDVMLLDAPGNGTVTVDAIKIS